jgi:tRNA(Ile)-lysidine synthase
MDKALMATAKLIDAIDTCLGAIPATTPPQQLVLGLSGGLDSMVLLQLLTQWQQQQPGRQLQAVYVHHGLSPHADAWAQFCAAQCQMRQVPFQCIRVAVAGQANLEQKARTARYQALAAFIHSPDTALCTAHHADDQLETILLALKRGSGLAGMAGIARYKAFAAGWLVRPLMSYRRAQLADFAMAQQLRWIEDESNQDLRFDRNYLRQQVIPMLTNRWPAFASTAGRSMEQLAQSQQAQILLLQPLLAKMASGRQLDLTALLAQPALLQPLLIRQWLAAFELNPSADRLAKIEQQLIRARPDACPEIQLAGWALRRYQQQLYLLDPTELQQLAQSSEAQAIRFGQPFTLADGRTACWQQEPMVWGDLASYLPLAVMPAAELQLAYGQLSLRFKPAGALQSKALKDWCKHWQLPPWQRPALLLFCSAGQLQAVVAPQRQADIGALNYSQTAASQALSWLSITPAQAFASTD